ncbi:Hypothetical predicted protein [Olea europaea subsp. europaea]|uniref:Uncharacterized protein n=1 Tax=Olea europaea subsp. europaea TaxID=158383 RepID=A0A8S0SWP5_OLEEU|nr:Hypothetical predicted protein [Olea europaea subsp. europaea]
MCNSNPQTYDFECPHNKFVSHNANTCTYKLHSEKINHHTTTTISTCTNTIITTHKTTTNNRPTMCSHRTTDRHQNNNEEREGGVIASQIDEWYSHYHTSVIAVEALDSAMEREREREMIFGVREWD